MGPKKGRTDSQALKITKRNMVAPRGKMVLARSLPMAPSIMFSRNSTIPPARPWSLPGTGFALRAAKYRRRTRKAVVNQEARMVLVMANLMGSGFSCGGKTGWEGRWTAGSGDRGFMPRNREPMAPVPRLTRRRMRKETASMTSSLVEQPMPLLFILPVYPRPEHLVQAKEGEKGTQDDAPDGQPWGGVELAVQPQAQDGPQHDAQGHIPAYAYEPKRPYPPLHNYQPELAHLITNRRRGSIKGERAGATLFC